MTPEEIKIINYHPKHTEELLRMWRTSFESAVGVVDPHPLHEQREYLLTQVVPHNTLRIVLHDSAIIGFIAANTESISQLYLKQSHQRLGIGSMLVNWAKEQSGGHLWLYTFARNTGAIAFYERQGFTITERGFEPEWKLEDVRMEWGARMKDEG